MTEITQTYSVGLTIYALHPKDKRYRQAQILDFAWAASIGSKYKVRFNDGTKAWISEQDLKVK